MPVHRLLPQGHSTNSITYLFLATDEQTVNVTIDVLDADGNSISHKVVSNVPFKRNRMTVLSSSASDFVEQ